MLQLRVFAIGNPVDKKGARVEKPKCSANVGHALARILSSSVKGKHLTGTMGLSVLYAD
jgi:hypothetical protein